jgi:hypothetical protein
MQQVHLVGATLNLAGIVLALAVSPWFLILCAMPTFGMYLHGATGFCPMEMILAKMPWNCKR